MGNEIKKCTVISGAPGNDAEFLRRKIDISSFIIAADSGYLKLKSAGIMPDLIMGDFDSSNKPDYKDCEIITLPCEKEYTDTFYCVRKAIELGYNDIIIFCALGNRFDHSYSNVLCLDYCRKNDVNCVICDEHNRLSLIVNKKIFKKEYNNFSLFAFLENCRGVKIKGAYYTAGFFGLDELDINLGDQFAQSNYVCDEVCEISLKSGTLLLVESND